MGGLGDWGIRGKVGTDCLPGHPVAFGGCKQSGSGREKDREALYNYTQVRNVAIQATHPNYVRILQGGMDPIQAMPTRKLSIKGNMAYISATCRLRWVSCAACTKLPDAYLEE